MGRVSVYARIRPGSDDCLAADGPTTVKMDGREGAQKRTWDFDGVLPPEAPQAAVYDDVGAPILDAVLQGYNGTVFAYGQTGAGKTHTLLNAGDGTGTASMGLVPRLAAALFVHIESDVRHVYRVKASFAQIYNEQIDDLLRPSSTNLKLKPTPTGGYAVDGLAEVHCKTAAQLLQAFDSGRRHLRYAETKLNKSSSRSHAVLQLSVSRRLRVLDANEARAQFGRAILAAQFSARNSLTVAAPPLTLAGAAHDGVDGDARVRRQAHRRRSRGLRAREALRGGSGPLGQADERSDQHQLEPARAVERDEGARVGGDARAVPRLEADAHAGGLDRRQLPHHLGRRRLTRGGRRWRVGRIPRVWRPRDEGGTPPERRFHLRRLHLHRRLLASPPPPPPPSSQVRTHEKINEATVLLDAAALAADFQEALRLRAEGGVGGRLLELEAQLREANERGGDVARLQSEMEGERARQKSELEAALAQVTGCAIATNHTRRLLHHHHLTSSTLHSRRRRRRTSRGAKRCPLSRRKCPRSRPRRRRRADGSPPRRRSARSSRPRWRRRRRGRRRR